MMSFIHIITTEKKLVCSHAHSFFKSQEGIGRRKSNTVWENPQKVSFQNKFNAGRVLVKVSCWMGRVLAKFSCWIKTKKGGKFQNFVALFSTKWDDLLDFHPLCQKVIWKAFLPAFAYKRKKKRVAVFCFCLPSVFHSTWHNVVLCVLLNRKKGVHLQHTILYVLEERSKQLIFFFSQLFSCRAQKTYATV